MKAPKKPRRKKRRTVLLHEHCRGVLRKRGGDGLWTCRKCGGEVDVGESRTSLILDHYPRARGYEE